MFVIDDLNNIKQLSIYVSQPSGECIGCIDSIIEESTASLSISLTQQYELHFDVSKRVDDYLTWYDYLQEGMYLFVESIGLFKMEEPVTTSDGTKDSKNITAYSCDSELDDKSCTLSLNMGTKTSQEYLVVYDEGETENLINPYTNLPYDWLVLYNTFPEQLQIVLEKYNNGYYGKPNSSGDISVIDKSIIDELDILFSLISRLKNKVISSIGDDGLVDYSLVEYVIYEYKDDTVSKIILTSSFKNRVTELIQFYKKYRKQLSLISIVLEKSGSNWEVGDIYGVNIGDYSLANKKYQFDVDETMYAFLVSTLAKTVKCIVSFDIIHRKVNLIPYDKIGNNTGILISYENLMNTMQISCNDDRLTTRLYVTGANDLGIEQVNFGLPYIDDITYKLNAKDSNGKRIYVSDELAEKYLQYIEFREAKRQLYIQASKDYRYYDSQISEIKYRVPNDSLKTDWGTFTLEELHASLTSYKNLMATLLTLYKEDYGLSGLNSDGSVNEDYLKTTIYWYDYAAYKSTITEIECAISTYPYYSEQDKWSSENIARYKDKINVWETDWSLYGTIELQAKIDAYTQNMSLLSETSVIRMSSNSDEIKTWNQLSSSEKETFGNLEANYYYDVYMTYFNNKKSAQVYLEMLQSKIKTLEEQKNNVQSQRVQIVSDVTLKNYFTEDECKIINRLYKDNSYTNENILVTSINTPEESIDTALELLNDGQEQLSIYSRPQVKFTISSDNLLGLPEYKSLWNDFKLGNYILIQYRDDTYVKLRMIGYSFNPCLPSSKDLTITFSENIHSKMGISDFANLIGELSSASNSLGSSSSVGSDGTYGESDAIDVTISNTMLAKLLNSELFGTRVTNIILDTLDVNSLTARYARFEGLAKGSTTIDGKCIETGYIKDIFYNGKDGDISNTRGSIINLDNGQFNLGGGRLVFDGAKLLFGSDVTLTWAQVTGTENVANTSDIPTKVSQLSNDSGYQNSNQVTAITKDTVTTSYVNALNITAKAVQSDWVYAGNVKAGQIRTGSIVSNDGLTTIINLDNGQFNLGGGKLTWNGSVLSVSGNITASTLTANTSGTIAGWSITSGGIQYDSSAYTVYVLTGNNVNKDFLVVYDKASKTWPFYVHADGTVYSTKFTAINANISGTITTGNLTATGGKIANFTISGGYLYNGIGIGTAGSCGISCGTALNGSDDWIFWAGNGTFRVNKNGSLWATGASLTNATVSGSITTTNLTVNNNLYMKCVYGTWNALDVSGNDGEQAALVIGKGFDRVDICGTSMLGNGGTDCDIHAYLRGGCRDFTMRQVIGTPESYPIAYIAARGGNRNDIRINALWGGDDFSSRGISVPASDIRLKENISNTQVEALPTIEKIRMYQFDWKQTGTHQELGFIADELEKINPNFAIGGGYDEDGRMDVKSVNTFYMLGYVVKGIQELHHSIKEYRERILLLESKIGQLNEEIFNLRKVL